MLMIVSLQSEVTEINRQKFLAELGKLLTFMYEEDRQAALSMYNAMFDRVEDEHALIQKLISPTRQAVLIARAYDAKERKLQVHAQSRQGSGEDDRSDDVPEFILVIDRIAQDLPGGYSPAPRAVLEDQFSLFEEDAMHVEESAQEEVPVEEEPRQEERSSLDDVEGFIPIDIPDISIPQTELPVTEAEPEEEEDAEEPVIPAEPEDKVEDFIAHMSLPEEVQQEEPVSEEDEAQQQMMAEFEESEESAVPAAAVNQAPATVRKARVFLLLLYILVSIPLGIVGMAILLTLTFFVLGVSVIVIAAGIMLFTAAFSGFTVIADILVVIGAAVIVLALGLLLLWVFIWLIGGVMVGFIRGILHLGGKWCYKEVAAA